MLKEGQKGVKVVKTRTLEVLAMLEEAKTVSIL